MKKSTDNKESNPPIPSVFQLVIAAAKRSKQISQIAKKRGLNPNQVALVESKHIKSTTLAVEEIRANKVHYIKNEEKKKVPSEEHTPQPDEGSENKN